MTRHLYPRRFVRVKEEGAVSSSGLLSHPVPETTIWGFYELEVSLVLRESLNLKELNTMPNESFMKNLEEETLTFCVCVVLGIEVRPLHQANIHRTLLSFFLNFKTGSC